MSVFHVYFAFKKKINKQFSLFQMINTKLSGWPGWSVKNKTKKYQKHYTSHSSVSTYTKWFLTITRCFLNHGWATFCLLIPALWINKEVFVWIVSSTLRVMLEEGKKIHSYNPFISMQLWLCSYIEFHIPLPLDPGT